MDATQVDWRMNPEDLHLLLGIGDRAGRLRRAGRLEINRSQLLMDLTAVHNHIVTLCLDDFLAADDPSFIEDIWGITLHLNRATIQFDDQFWPRFASAVVV